MRWVALGALLVGCLHGKSHPCTGDNGASWVCPEDKACAAAPIYCGTTDEVGACDGKMERDPCSTMLVQDGLCIANVCESCSYDIAGCRYVGWNPMTSPTPLLLNAIAFTGFGEAYAAGDMGTMLRYDIAGWAADTRFPTASLTGQSIVAMTAVGAKVYALTNSNGMAVYVLDGSGWNPLPAALATTYISMWVAPSGDIFLGGLFGRLAHYDGTTWTETTMGGGTTTYSAMWGTSATDVYAAGFTANNSTILRFDGTNWSPVAVPNAGRLGAIWGSGGEIFAAGTSILHATAGSFTLAAATPAITAHSIWGSSPTDVFVVGDGGAILHWDGVVWKQMKVSFNTKLAAISGSSAAEVIAVGDLGAIERFTGAGWVVAGTQPGATRLRSVWVASPAEAFATGDISSSTIYHLQGTTWTPETANPAIAAALVSVWGRSPSDVFAVGQLAAGHRASTTSWANISSGSIGGAVAMWGDASSVYAVGNSVAKYDGAAWTVAAPALDLAGVWVDPAGKVWVAGQSGIGHLDGSAVTFDVSNANFSSIWGTTATDIYSAGVGDIRHYDGATWTKMTLPTTATLTGIWGRATDDVFAVGAGNTVLHYHAGLWKAFTTPFSSDLTSVSGAGDAIFMTAGDGSVYELLDTSP